MSRVSASRFRAAIRPWVRAQVVSCFAAGPDRRDPERPAVGCGNDLDVAAVVLVLARPPQVGFVRARGGDAIGTDDGAVEVEVCKAGRGRALQCGGQVRAVVGEHSYQGLLAYLMPGQARLMSLVRKISDLSDGRHSQYSEPRPHYLGES
jgi:hypothetical protein